MIHFTRTSPTGNTNGTATADDRRRAPRVQLLSRLHGHTVSLDLPVRVVQISLGGMAIETAVPFPVGAVHVFNLTMGDDSVTELTGRVMHCRNTAADSATPLFTTGIQFVEGESDEPAAADLLRRVQ